MNINNVKVEIATLQENRSLKNQRNSNFPPISKFKFSANFRIQNLAFFKIKANSNFPPISKLEILAFLKHGKFKFPANFRIQKFDLFQNIGKFKFPANFEIFQR